MVYCTKCGTKNEEAVEHCIKCGAPLRVSREESLDKRMEKWGEDFGRRAEQWGEDFGKRVENECFGLPHGGSIAGLIIGAIIVIVGLSLALGIDVWHYLWALIIIAVGALIVIGTLYSLRRKS